MGTQSIKEKTRGLRLARTGIILNETNFYNAPLLDGTYEKIKPLV